MNRQEIIENVFKISDHIIDINQLAQIANFSDEEIEITKLFSDSLVRNDKFISSEKINLEWLGYDSKNRCISLLNKKIVRNFIENLDYVIDESSDKKESKKMYDVSFECLKSLLSHSKGQDSKKIRTILLKVEELIDILKELQFKIDLNAMNTQNKIYEKRITGLTKSYNNLLQKLQDTEKEVEEFRAKQKTTFCSKIKNLFGIQS